MDSQKGFKQKSDLLLWPPCVADADIKFSSCGFFFFLLLLFSSPNLSRRRLNVYHTFTRDVALVRLQNACVKCAARGSLKYRTQKSPTRVYMGQCPT